jgi:pimeloyl-ACP methyl ester carboxylesterase
MILSLLLETIVGLSRRRSAMFHPDDLDGPKTERESAPHLWRSSALGELSEVQIGQSRLQYFRRGEGPKIVFAHGWLSNANLWRKLVKSLADRYACYVLDLPLGAHRVPMHPEADLSPTGCGSLIAAVMDELDLTEVTLVGNDSGGAYSQIAIASGTNRVARLVLNSCETPYGDFPPAPFDGLPGLAKDPAALGQLLEALRDRSMRATAPAFGLLIKHPIGDLVSDSYALPCVSDARILHDTSKVMSTAATGPVREAGRQLIADFKHPVLLVWSPEDHVFAVADAQRYAEALSDGRLALVEDAYSFTPEDQPVRLAEEIARFISADQEHRG